MFFFKCSIKSSHFVLRSLVTRVTSYPNHLVPNQNHFVPPTRVELSVCKSLSVCLSVRVISSLISVYFHGNINNKMQEDQNKISSAQVSLSNCGTVYFKLKCLLKRSSTCLGRVATAHLTQTLVIIKLVIIILPIRLDLGTERLRTNVTSNPSHCIPKSLHTQVTSNPSH